MPNG
jgi:hypothetical protein